MYVLHIQIDENYNNGVQWEREKRGEGKMKKKVVKPFQWIDRKAAVLEVSNLCKVFDLDTAINGVLHKYANNVDNITPYQLRNFKSLVRKKIESK